MPSKSLRRNRATWLGADTQDRANFLVHVNVGNRQTGDGGYEDHILHRRWAGT